jgi:hypothetical protein
MDTQTIDQEFEKLQGEFEDVAKTVQALATKMQAAEQAGDKNATEWLGDLKQVAQDIGDEQTQAKVLLLALHSFITGVAQGQEATADDSAKNPPLYAPGHEPPAQPPPQTVYVQQPGMMMGGPVGGMFGGYLGGGFARSMEMGAAMGLGSSLISSIFR